MSAKEIIHERQTAQDPDGIEMVKPADWSGAQPKEIDLSAVETAELVDEKNTVLSGPADTDDVLDHTIHLQDDPSIPAITFRSLFLGVGLSVFGGTISGIYFFKPQTVTLPPVFLAVIAFILGQAMAYGIPRRGRLGRFLNPHHFTVKEHLAIIIMSNSATLSIFILISSQYLGYGIVGLMRRTLVYPKNMLWPSNIPVNSMLENLHLYFAENRKPLRVFLIVFACIFVWEIFPQWICPILTGVSIFCLADQNSAVFTTIFGGADGNEGLGLFSLCFDWQYISGGTSPLYFPISSLISQGIGICGCIVLFASVYYSNVWDALKFPFLGQIILSDDSTPGNYTQWNQSLAIGADNYINMTVVDEIGLPNMTASNVLNLLLTNMTIAAAFVHLFLWYPTEVKSTFAFLHPSNIRNNVLLLFSSPRAYFRRTSHDQVKPHYDPHYSLILGYKPCPDWWYGLVLVLSLVIGLIVVYESDSTLPWWQYFVAVVLGWVLIIILGSMQAITGVNFTIQSLVQMIGGYMRPGDPVANMYFSLYGYNALIQGKLLAQDIKLAQYGHLAPRITFWMQMIGTLIGAIMNYVMANNIISNQREILLSVEGSNIWSGQSAQQFNSQAIAFGGLPYQLFSVGGKYEWVTLSMLFGFVVPLPFWFLHKRFPTLGLDLVNTAVVVFYLSYLNVGINSSLMMFFFFGFMSQWYIRRRYPNIFVRYNYVVSAALDGGTSVMVFILSFAVLGAAGTAVAFPNYWGNNQGGNIDRCYSVSTP